MAAEEALTLLAGVTELRVAKGRKVVRVDLSAEGRPSDGQLVGMMVSRWGRLRAPTLKIGSILVVGYNPDILTSVFEG